MKFRSSLEYRSRKSPVASSTGLVSSSQIPATQAGVEILNHGGNAADAAIAVAAALQVTQPCSTGMGGDCFVLYYEAATRRVFALNGSGRAPKGLTLDLAAKVAVGGNLPDYHPYTVTIPGAPAAWCELAKRFGSLPLTSTLAPAVDLAERGFPVAPLTSMWWREGAAEQLSNTPNGRELMAEDGGPHPGMIMRLPNLARSLRTIGEEGRKGFYEGWIAGRIVESVRELGGVITEQDLADHTSEWVEPISTQYRAATVLECPPNGQGLAVLIALNILKTFDLASHQSLSTERYHLMIEAMRLAFADAARYIADPHMADVPVEELLSESYAEQRAALIDPRRASAPPPGDPVGYESGSDTVYFSVLDAWGNGCSFINSNFMGFGTGIVPRGCGFSLQNRGRGFRLDPGHPNCLAPGKRPFHTIIPGMITDSDTGELRTIFGVMGGVMQPQGHLQVVSALMDDGVDPQSALDRPRFQLSQGRADGELLLEDAVPTDAIEGLRQRGHKVRVVGPVERPVFGLGQIITRENSGVWWAGCDPRSDGCALPASRPISGSL